MDTGNLADPDPVETAVTIQIGVELAQAFDVHIDCLGNFWQGQWLGAFFTINVRFPAPLTDIFAVAFIDALDPVPQPTGEGF